MVPYTYLGRLEYRVHDHDREQPVYFTWQILDWNLPDHVRDRIKLTYEGGTVLEERKSDSARNQTGLVSSSRPERYIAPGGREH